ncbi:uncharacterized protein LOC119242802 [Talpa occidentalis]|uniref:uncharacterized protein LOC119242802 n=1 Tax=Talpa occidentalis TaxID=50954 RepID=UPI00188F9CE4|nr:uncharacterized protein LOC119242802 [Talpa occidentalis]
MLPPSPLRRFRKWSRRRGSGRGWDGPCHRNASGPAGPPLARPPTASLPGAPRRPCAGFLRSAGGRGQFSQLYPRPAWEEVPAGVVGDTGGGGGDSNPEFAQSREASAQRRQRWQDSVNADSLVQKARLRPKSAPQISVARTPSRAQRVESEPDPQWTMKAAVSTPRAVARLGQGGQRRRVRHLGQARGRNVWNPKIFHVLHDTEQDISAFY